MGAIAAMSCHSVTVQFHVPHLDIIGGSLRKCTADEIAITFGGKNGDFRARLREFILRGAAPNWMGEGRAVRVMALMDR